MNRRGFIGRLAALIGVVVAPSVVLPAKGRIADQWTADETGVMRHQNKEPIRYNKLLNPNRHFRQSLHGDG